MKRIAFARIAQETNALSPVPTTLADFERSHYHEGAAVLEIATAGREVPGVFERAELTGFVAAVRARRAEIEPVPILSAWTTPSGPLSRACFETLEGRLVEGLRRAGPLDGVYLCLHGAMGAHDLRDPESRLLRSVREVIGERPLVVSHDLHANLTRARVETADAIVGYQTNPHRDLAKIGAKAGRIAIGAVLGELRPTMAWRSLPMILGGGKTIDLLAPMRAVFRRLRRTERGRVLASSLFMVHPFNDDPALGWSTCVVTDDDRDAAERIADELAELCWQVRDEPPPRFASATEAIADARAARVRRRLGCVTLADTSDVVAAGAPGDSTHLIRALRDDAGDLLVYCALRDPAAVAQLWPRPIGEPVTLPIGGTLDPARSPPLEVSGHMLGKHERHGFGRSVVLAVDHLRIVIVEGPALVVRPAFYADVGLSVWRADIVVVKSFFLFFPMFLLHARKTIHVRTAGSTDFDAAFALAFDGPVHPRDPVADWRPRDRLRRHGDLPGVSGRTAAGCPKS